MGESVTSDLAQFEKRTVAIGTDHEAQGIDVRGLTDNDDRCGRVRRPAASGCGIAHSFERLLRRFGALILRDII